MSQSATTNSQMKKLPKNRNNKTWRYLTAETTNVLSYVIEKKMITE